MLNALSIVRENVIVEPEAALEGMRPFFMHKQAWRRQKCYP